MMCGVHVVSPLRTLTVIDAPTSYSIASLLPPASTCCCCAAAPPRRYLIVGAGPGGLQMAHYLHTAARDYLVLDKEPHAGSFFVKYPRWRQLISINKINTGRSELDYNMRHDWNSLLSEPSHSATQGEQGAAAGALEVPCPQEAPGVQCYASSYSSTDPALTIEGVKPGLRFRDYTWTYYPEADKLAGYLQRWADGLSLPGSPLSNSSSSPSAAAPSPPQSGGLNIRYNVSVSSIAPGAASVPPSADDWKARTMRARAEGRL